MNDMIYLLRLYRRVEDELATKQATCGLKTGPVWEVRYELAKIKSDIDYRARFLLLTRLDVAKHWSEGYESEVTAYLLWKSLNPDRDELTDSED